MQKVIKVLITYYNLYKFQTINTYYLGSQNYEATSKQKSTFPRIHKPGNYVNIVGSKSYLQINVKS